MYRQFTCIIFMFFLLPIISFADSGSSQRAIDRIVQTQDQWKNTVVKGQQALLPANSAKIVGGSTVSRAAHREFALILFTDSLGNVVSFCGGTLISPNKVLTAAHCTYGRSNARTFVVPQYYSDNDNVLQSDIYRVSDRDAHPGYIASRYDYDVSVLTLSRNSATPTAKLFAADSTLENYQATIIGVGLLSEGGALPITLQGTKVPIVSNATCRNSYGATISDRMLCAGLISGGRDSCQGDSGGPLWVNYDGEKVQAGITSFGQGCARPNFYGVYARTSALAEFIAQYAPEAEFLTDVPNIGPMLQVLLLDDVVYEPPVCNQDIVIGETVNTQFSTPCYDFTDSEYFKTFTFTLDTARQITITSPSSTDIYAYINLYSGPNHNGTLIDSEPTYVNDATIVNELSAGTYTIEITSSTVAAPIELSTQENQCQSTSLAVGTTVQSGFSSNCRSISVYDHRYASYYSFTLNQPQQISIISNSLADSGNYLRLYSGDDVTSNYMYSANYFENQAVLVKNLDAGTYTIEITNSNVNDTVDLSLLINQCQISTVTLNATIQDNYTSDCRSIGQYNHPYARYYSLTLNQIQHLSLTSKAIGDFDSRLSLFAGTDVTIDPIDSDNAYVTDAVLVNELSTGMYTIEVTSSKLDVLTNLDIRVNNCLVSLIDIDVVTDGNFNPGCRKIAGISHPYTLYHSFTLDQAKTIALRTRSSVNEVVELKLFSGADTSGIAIDGDSANNTEQVILLNHLDAGIYTVEVSSENLLSTVQTIYSANDCPVLPVNLNTSNQEGFVEQCRSIRSYNHSYAHYYTFTLNQNQVITITSPSSTDTDAYLRLYSGTNVSAPPLDSDGMFFGGGATLSNNLNAGTYTIEVTSSNLATITDLTISGN